MGAMSCPALHLCSTTATRNEPWRNLSKPKAIAFKSIHMQSAAQEMDTDARAYIIYFLAANDDLDIAPML